MELTTDVLVVGGGLGGVAAALAAVRLGQRVVLTESTDWLGGQLTSQLVPPDEHPWIEEYAAPGYSELRRRIRDYYRRNYPLRPEVAADPLLDPGRGVVSRFCHEPRVAAAVLEEMLAPWRASGHLTVHLEHEPIAAHTGGDEIDAVTLRDLRSGNELTVSAAYVVDATELGDLVELAGVEHVVGAESRATTGELHAPEVADPLDQQAFSWCFALEHRPGEDHTIDRPAGYAHWHDHIAPFWPGPQLSWEDVVPVTLERREWRLFEANPDRLAPFSLWRYRRILASSNFLDGAIPDVTVVNWPQLDYWEQPLVGAADPAAALAASRDLSLSFLYWMQTEGGYPGLRLRPDVTGTADGLAKAPYIRESRRIQAEFTVLEQHVGVEARPDGSGSEVFADTVGLGRYRIDLHPSTAGRSYVDIEAYPFQIPLGALIPVRVDNLLPANKNIGTTHITNGCYRLHPVEWSIGEAVGALVSFCLTNGLSPRKVRNDPNHLADYQRMLTNELGVRLAWPDEIRTHRD